MLLHLYIYNQIPRQPPAISSLSHPREVNAASIVHPWQDLYEDDFLLGPLALPGAGPAKLQVDPSLSPATRAYMGKGRWRKANLHLAGPTAFIAKLLGTFPVNPLPRAFGAGDFPLRAYLLYSSSDGLLEFDL